jgi:hypothetical protein
MEDLGHRVSHLGVPKGVPVLSSDGQEIGKLELVLSDERTGIFDGIVVDTKPGPGGWKFVDAPEVGELHERGIVLRIDAAACENLPEPTGNPAVMRLGDLSGVQEKLRRAWRSLSGRR